jgi:hypothetical protein
VRQCRSVTAAISLVAVAAVACLATAGAAAAGAAKPPGGGLARAQLIGRFSPHGASSPVPGLASSGSEVMAAVVATLAVLALAFLIVTFSRRRMTSAA